MNNQNKTDETDMPTNAYVTIKRDENGKVRCYVGEQPTTEYRGTKFVDNVIDFCKIQGRNPEISELHVGAFATYGKFAKPGNPSPVFGPNTWIRVKYKDGTIGSWVFHASYASKFGPDAWDRVEFEEGTMHCFTVLLYTGVGFSTGSNVKGCCAVWWMSECVKAVAENQMLYAAVVKRPIDKTTQNQMLATSNENLNVKTDETDMPTNAYVTIKRDENGKVKCYIGGNLATEGTKYQGYSLFLTEVAQEHFEWMQIINPEISEFHIGTFVTCGERAKPGDPSPEPGPNTWCRVKFKDGAIGSWVYHYGSGLALYLFLYDCTYDVDQDPNFRAAVFKKQNNETAQNKTPLISNKPQHVDIGALAQLSVAKQK